VFVSASSTASMLLTLTIAGVAIRTQGAANVENSISGTIPYGASYSATVSAGTPTLGTWVELRL
jgi:hypothetical protein